MRHLVPAVAAPVPALLLVIAALAAPEAAAQHVWRIGDHAYHVTGQDLDQSSDTGRAAMLARVERAASRLCAHEPLAIDRRACATASVAAAARGSATLRRALSERDATALAQR
ncbi:UrcA family protein [Sphingomonas sp. BK235]|jgi:UrcA family protein|uniref:UrcA family protein n=1 Tax=Sphingomonas sp. BK235 TaxID=2512131 RepID=UPI00104D71B0|nr:UrcA family protein [Sphingomonas sp. BK235]TCP36710.1 UrcA family protein [Sphingomonas sp. BK235]